MSNEFEEGPMRRSFLLVVLALGSLNQALAQNDPPARTVANFMLRDVTGKDWSLAACKNKAIVIAFIGTQCPINNAYMPRLVELETKYRDKGVQFVAINSNEHDSLDSVAKHARKYKLTFPVLRDDKHVVANRFRAERHPIVYLLDDKYMILYQGRIDDQFGIGHTKPAATRRDLAIAIDEVLAGKGVTTASTSVQGCFITRVPAAKKKSDVTYTKDVSRIVQNRCQECHRAGQIGPMPLLTYDDVASWSLMIREVIDEQRMPPWHADPKHGKFRNDRRLSESDRSTFLAWIDAGCPEGDAKDLPEPRRFVQGWSIGQPDVVLTMPQAFTVPAKSVRNSIPYKHMRIPTNFAEDRWIQAVEARPGNYEVVHHIIAYIAQSGKRLKSASDGIGSGMLVAYAPGDLGSIFPAGGAKKLPKGAEIVLQMHYTPTGTEQTDKSSIGLIFAKKPPENEIRTRAITQQLFMIPPNAGDHKVVSATTFAKDAVLYSLFPHMHLRGKSFSFEAIYPDKRREVLLNVPHYDFGWQSNYILEKPLRLPAGTRIECTAKFDNSPKNPNNPNPKAYVFWGEQTWEEMMIGFVDYAIVESGGEKK